MGEVQRQGFVSPVCEALQQRVTTKGPYNVGADEFLRDVWRLAANIREGGLASGQADRALARRGAGRRRSARVPQGRGLAGQAQRG